MFPKSKPQLLNLKKEAGNATTATTPAYATNRRKIYINHREYSQSEKQAFLDPR
jgi:hypothetical protein